MTKRLNHKFNEFSSYDNLFIAYLKARRHKSYQPQVKKFDLVYDEKLKALSAMLRKREFHTAAYRIHTIHEPKERLIYSLPFYPDRIVHHALMNILEPYWDQMMIRDSYSCRSGKGTHLASNVMIPWVKNSKYILQCDIRKFFPSINHDILSSLVHHKIKDKRLLEVIDDIIYSVPGESNVPIGNYISQWFGNLYLTEVDQFIKKEFKIKYYLRYCDDFACFSNDKYLLKELSEALKIFIHDHLKLDFSKCKLYSTKEGVDMMGYVHFPDGKVLIRKSTVKIIIKRMKNYMNRVSHEISINNEFVKASIASSKGVSCHSNSQDPRLLEIINSLSEIIELEEVYETIKVEREFVKECYQTIKDNRDEYIKFLNINLNYMDFDYEFSRLILNDNDYLLEEEILA